LLSKNFSTFALITFVSQLRCKGTIIF